MDRVRGVRGSRVEWFINSVLWSSRRLLNQFAQNWRTSRGLSRWIVRFRSLRRVVYSAGRLACDEDEAIVYRKLCVCDNKGVYHLVNRVDSLDSRIAGNHKGIAIVFELEGALELSPF